MIRCQLPAASSVGQSGGNAGARCAGDHPSVPPVLHAEIPGDGAYGAPTSQGLEAPMERSLSPETESLQDSLEH